MAFFPPGQGASSRAIGMLLTVRLRNSCHTFSKLSRARTPLAATAPCRKRCTKPGGGSGQERNRFGRPFFFGPPLWSGARRRDKRLACPALRRVLNRKSTRLNPSHVA